MPLSIAFILKHIRGDSTAAADSLFTPQFQEVLGTLITREEIANLGAQFLATGAAYADVDQRLDNAKTTAMSRDQGGYYSGTNTVIYLNAEDIASLSQSDRNTKTWSPADGSLIQIVNVSKDTNGVYVAETQEVEAITIACSPGTDVVNHYGGPGNADPGEIKLGDKEDDPGGGGGDPPINPDDPGWYDSSDDEGE